MTAGSGGSLTVSSVGGAPGWAADFRRAVVESGGELIDSFRIEPETIDEAIVVLNG